MLSSVFQALGNGVFSLTVSICRQLVVLIPAAWLLSRTGEVNMVWWAFIIAEVASLALSLVSWPASTVPSSSRSPKSRTRPYNLKGT